MQKKEIKCISLHQREMSPHGTRRGGKWRICWLEDPSVLCWPNKKHWINSDTLGLHRQRPGWKRTVGKCEVEDWTSLLPAHDGNKKLSTFQISLLTSTGIWRIQFINMTESLGQQNWGRDVDPHWRAEPSPNWLHTKAVLPTSNKVDDTICNKKAINICSLIINNQSLREYQSATWKFFDILQWHKPTWEGLRRKSAVFHPVQFRIKMTRCLAGYHPFML